MKNILLGILVLVIGCSKVNKLINPEINICVLTQSENNSYECYLDISENDCMDYADAENYSFDQYSDDQTCEEFCATVENSDCYTMD
jgi:hypothetical protein